MRDLAKKHKSVSLIKIEALAEAQISKLFREFKRYDEISDFRHVDWRIFWPCEDRHARLIAPN